MTSNDPLASILARLSVTYFSGIVILCMFGCHPEEDTFLTCPWHKIYREGVVGVKSSNYTLKITIFCEYVKFGAIS